MKPLFRSLPWLLATILFAGCASITPPPRVERPPVDDSAVEAINALDRGDYNKAIPLLTRLRDSSQPPKRQEYEIYLAEAYHKSDRDQQAQQLLDAINANLLSPHMAMRRQLLRGDIALRQNPDLALSLLLKPAAPESERALHADYHLLRAYAFNRLANYLESAREYVLREPFLLSDTERETNHASIWQSLSSLSREAVEKMKVQPPPDVLSGWLELAALAKNTSLSQEAMSQRLGQWRSAYPLHPAPQQLLDDLLARSLDLSLRPTTIALLLPLSGHYAQAGSAVRDGFFAAYQQSPGHEQIRINVYDIGTQPEMALSNYQRAVQEGAQFVVGPLDKLAVQGLAAGGALPVPVLALNLAEGVENDNLFQFALAPEDEAFEAAERAWADGHSRIALILPDDPLGKRLGDAFLARWQELGGFVAGQALYDPQATDYSNAIEDLLHLSSSNARFNRLTQTMGKRYEFTPRRRQDIDAIFIAALPRQGRLLRPQLRFHYAGDIPVYTTSLVYGGNPDANQDRDLDGVMFTDLPWTLQAPTPQQQLRSNTQTPLGQYGGQLQRLVAMGIDAYHLVPMLRVMQHYPTERYQGETGTLRVGSGNRILRQTQWARFQSGLPQLLEKRLEQNGGR